MKSTGEDPDPAQLPQDELRPLQLDFDDWYVEEGAGHAEAIAHYLALPGDDPSLAAAAALEAAWLNFDELIGWTPQRRRGWLTITVKYELGDQRRTAGHKARLTAVDIDDTETHGRRPQTTESRELAAVVEESYVNGLLKFALAPLSEDQKVAFFLEYLADCPRSEIAQQLGVTERKVRRWNERTFERVQQVFRERG